MKTQRQRVFVSYSRRDSEWLDRLRVHLKPLERADLVELWDDTRIEPGRIWHEDIKKVLDTARVAILLISPDFLASDFIAENELPPLLAAANDEGLTVLPVIIRPSRFGNEPRLSRFQSVNDPSKPLVDLSEGDRDRIWVRLSEAVEKTLKEHREPNPNRTAAIIADDISEMLSIARDSKQSDTFEETRGFDIVKLRFPKQEVKKAVKYSDAARKISYEFISVDVASSVRIGHLFVKRRINIGNTMRHFFEHLKFSLNALIICTPRVVNPETGQEIDRLLSLKNKVDVTDKRHSLGAVEYFYIDDYVWRYCLAEHAHILNVNIEEEEYFVDQELFWKSDGVEHSKLSLRYIRQLVERDVQKNPVSIVVGTAGVGKTTFCEQAARLINSYDKKRALIISSADLRHDSPDIEVSSISDLYKYYQTKIQTDSNAVLEPDNLEINISCGNIVLIIDGLEEIESILSDRFDLQMFLESCISLNESYRKCTIIITSRDVFSDRYLGKKSINFCSLLGFSEDLLGTYLKKRLPEEDRKVASRYITVFDVTQRDRHIPLYLSLICDLIERSKYQHTSSFSKVSESKYFFRAFPFDKLIFELLEREIGKQSLEISCDDYFELLAEIAISHQGSISRDDLDEYIEVMIMPESGSGDPDNKYPQFYVSPLLSFDHKIERHTLKYDYLETWIRSRYFIHNFVTENYINLVDLLTELHDGSSALFAELREFKQKVSFKYAELGQRLLRHLTDLVSTEHSSVYRVTGRNSKPISGLLYFLLVGPEKSRTDYTSELVNLYNGTTINYLCVYGDFIPLDFSDLKIYFSWFERYGNFEKCKFPSGRKVFFDSVFKGMKPRLGAVLRHDLFDDSCSLNRELEDAFTAGVASAGKVYSQVQTDLTRILKVGFRSGSFAWKSINVYKKVALKSNIKLTQYLRFLTEEGVLTKKSDKFNEKKYGYVVSAEFKSSAKRLITDNIVSPKLELTIFRIIETYYTVN